MENSKRVVLTEEQIELVLKHLDTVLQQAHNFNYNIPYIDQDKTDEEVENNLEKFRVFFDEVSRFFGSSVMTINPDECGMYFIKVSQRVIQLATNLVINEEVTSEMGIQIAVVGVNKCNERYEMYSFIDTLKNLID